MKRPIANIISGAMALAVGLLTVWISVRYVKPPEDSIDWLVLILSGLTTGTIAFFMTWGHFQEDPIPEPLAVGPANVPQVFIYCPKCGGPGERYRLTLHEFFFLPAQIMDWFRPRYRCSKCKHWWWERRG